MPDTMTGRTISIDMIHAALNLITYHDGDHIEAPEPICAWPRLCGGQNCQFPRYFRDGPHGLVAHVLVELGYPHDLLKALDMEYEISELMHPGVKIGRSRNQALARIDSRGVALLSYLQDHQKCGWSWTDITDAAFRPRKMIPFLDRRRRPWLY